MIEGVRNFGERERIAASLSSTEVVAALRPSMRALAYALKKEPETLNPPFGAVVAAAYDGLYACGGRTMPFADRHRGFAVSEGHRIRIAGVFGFALATRDM